MNRAEEDYIKLIYELTDEKNQKLTKSNEIAERFNFTDQSVNEMIKKLEKKHLVSFVPYKGISLTKKGKLIAIGMIRAHRIWEVFLTTKLGIPWEQVHEDAEMLEHATSETVLRKMYDYLGEPKYCQHGNPIPDFKNHVEQLNYQPLFDTKIHDRFKVLRVLDHKDLLIYLNEVNIKLHDELLILEKDDFNEWIKVSNKNHSFSISYKTARMLYGEITSN